MSKLTFRIFCKQKKYQLMQMIKIVHENEAWEIRAKFK